MPISKETKSKIVSLIQVEMADEAERRRQSIAAEPRVDLDPEDDGQHPYIKHPYIKHPYIKHPYIKHPYIKHPYIKHPYNKHTPND